MRKGIATAVAVLMAAAVFAAGKAEDATDGSIYFFYKPVFNEMLDLERNRFQHLLEDTLLEIQGWEGKNR